MFNMPQSYFDNWLSSGHDIWSYDFVERDPEYDDWVDVRAPIPTLDCVYHK